MLTKEPLALVLCALGIVIYLLMVRRNPLELATHRWPWLTVAVAVAVGATWYLPALVRTRGAIAGGQLMQENFRHLVPSGLGGTGQARRPFYYIMARFIPASLPLSLFSPALLLMLPPFRQAEP